MNAIVQARTAVVLQVEVSDVRLLVQVHDASPVGLEQHPAAIDDPLATSERGMELLDPCSDSWGWYGHGAGTFVWLALRTAACQLPAPPGSTSRNRARRSPEPEPGRRPDR